VQLPPGTRPLRTAREREAVASPLRVELLEHLQHAGTASVAELARSMGRSPTLLHYHIKLLAAAGLVRVAGRRAAGRRGESVYAMTAEHFAVAGHPGDRTTLAAALRTLGAVLRLSQREAARALFAGRIVPRGRRRDFHARRLRAPLSPDARARLNRLLDQIESLFEAELKRGARRGATGPEPDDSEIAALTFVLAPPAQSKERKR
jgi:DNA-binding transcriptional ArsR family regulator